MAMVVKQHGVFAITSEGRTSFYIAQDFGELQDVVGRLRAVRTVKDRVPTARGPEVFRLTEYAQNGFPVAFTEQQRLFKPLDRKDYDDLVERIRLGDKRAASYVIDYDQNEFSVARWYRNHLDRRHAGLDEVIDAYTRTLKDANQSSLGVDMKKFNAALDDLMVPGSLEGQLNAARYPASQQETAGREAESPGDDLAQSCGPEMAM